MAERHFFLERQETDFESRAFVFFYPDIRTKPFCDKREVPAQSLCRDGELAVEGTEPVGLEFFAGYFFIVGIPQGDGIGASGHDMRVVRIFHISDPFEEYVLPRPVDAPVRKE